MGFMDFLFGEDETKRAEEANKTLQDAYVAKELSRGTDSYDNYNTYFNDLYKNSMQEAKNSKYNTFGNGLIGSILNPIGQAGSAGIDLLTSGTSKWENGSRDLASDLGAIGETALSVIPFGGIAKGATTGAKSLGKTIAKDAALGAGFGAAGTLREEGSNTNLNDVLASSAIGAGLGGAIGGAAKLGSNFANKAKMVRSPQAQAAANNIVNGTGGMTKNLLGDGANGATVGTKGVYQNTPAYQNALWTANRGNLAKTGLGRVAQGIGDTMSYNKLNGNKITDMANNTAVGRTLSNILSTKAGKVGAGVGGGLLLANLLKNNGNSGNNLSNEDIQSIYNYYGGY